MPLYSIDTSALVHGWQRAYPPDIFPALWDRIDELIQAGHLRASIEVYYELEKKADGLFEWCKDRKDTLFLEIDNPIQAHVAQIMATYPRLVDTRKGLSTADPFVIGLSKCYNPAGAVVTQEQGGSAAKPRIQFVCQQEGIRCLNLLELIQDQGWVFRRP